MSRVEMIVLIGVIVVLIAFAYGPVVDYFTNGKVVRGVNSARTLSTLLAQYATDNNGVYPVGEGTRAAGKSEGIALNLLQNNYTPDASIFSVGSTPKYRGSGGDYADLKAENISWDFTAGANATTGITSAAPDNLPIVFTTGEEIDYRAKVKPGEAYLVSLTDAGPFDHEGMAVGYKNCSVKFAPGKRGDDGSYTTTDFMAPSWADKGSYTQIKP